MRAWQIIPTRTRTPPFGNHVDLGSSLHFLSYLDAARVVQVWAAGDCRRGQSLVVWAIAEGRGAAREIDRANPPLPSALFAHNARGNNGLFCSSAMTENLPTSFALALACRIIFARTRTNTRSALPPLRVLNSRAGVSGRRAHGQHAIALVCDSESQA